MAVACTGLHVLSSRHMDIKFLFDNWLSRELSCLCGVSLLYQERFRQLALSGRLSRSYGEDVWRARVTAHSHMCVSANPVALTILFYCTHT